MSLNYIRFLKVDDLVYIYIDIFVISKLVVLDKILNGWTILSKT